MNFIKLKNNLDLANYSIDETTNSYGMEVNGVFKGIKYSKTDTTLKESLFNLIPKENRHFFDISVMQVNTYIPPHTDSNIMATINFYIKTSNCVTQFYSFNTDAPRKEQLKTQTNGYLFSIHDLNAEDKFVASSGEIWLLNVTKPHSVQPIVNGPVDRVALCLSSRKFNFDETVALLQATGAL